MTEKYVTYFKEAGEPFFKRDTVHATLAAAELHVKAVLLEENPFFRPPVEGEVRLKSALVAEAKEDLDRAHAEYGMCSDNDGVVGNAIENLQEMEAL